MPVYNEAFTIHRVIERVLAVPLPIELIIVDDFSTDGTRDHLRTIEETAAQLPKASPDSSVHVLYHTHNQGKGAAIRTAVGHATGDITIVQDADLEYDPAEFPRLIDPILAGDADVVFGSRFRGDISRVHMFWHTVGNKFLTGLSNMFTNLNLTDMETCYKAFKTEILKSIPIRSNRFGFEPEITAKVAKLRCRIYEVPISYRGRGYAEGKKIGWRDGVKAVFTILRFWIVDDIVDRSMTRHNLRLLEGTGHYNRWLFDRCRPFIGGNVLEVGAGIGLMTKFLAERPKVTATESSDALLFRLRQTVQEFPNIAVRKVNFADAPLSALPRDFDTVLLVNNLQTQEDDTAILKQLFDRLAPLGRMIIVVPAHPSLFSELDRAQGYRRRYSKAQLKSALESVGFEVEFTRFLNGVGALGWFLNGRILRRRYPPTRQIRLFDLFVPLLSVENRIEPPFGLSILAVARRPE